VSVRRRLPDGRSSDVLGDLISWSGGRLIVRRSDGEEVTVDESAVVAGRVVPPPPPPRRPGVPHASAAEMQRIASAGWPAGETEPLGEWLLRAHGGITGRANSVMAVGDPGCELETALERVREWYAERRLPALLQVPEGDPVDRGVAAAGWVQQHVTIVQTAPIPATLDLIPARDDVDADVTSMPSAEWLALMHDLDEQDPDTHIAILTGPPTVGFATVRREGEAVAIGRASIEGPWAGVTSVDVPSAHRRQGLGAAVMRVLLDWAAEHDARAAYLQVRALNQPALALYRRLGFLTHHPYCYRVPPAPPDAPG